MSDQTMNGAEIIFAERKRQVEAEGWTPEHDDEHRHAELATAASCYLLLAERQVLDPASGLPAEPICWPWEVSWWKPSEDPVRNLAKAGALIAAEIDRLRRRK